MSRSKAKFRPIVIILSLIGLIIGLSGIHFMTSQLTAHKKLKPKSVSAFNEIFGVPGPDAEFGRFTKSNTFLCVSLPLPCPPYDIKGVEVRTGDKQALSEASRAALRQLKAQWPHYWPTVHAGLEELLKESGCADRVTDSKILLSTKLSSNYAPASEIKVLLSFEPFGGIFDVTVADGIVLDSGVAF